MHHDGQIYHYIVDDISLNTYNNILATKIWEGNEGNTTTCVLAVADSEHTCYRWLHHRVDR